MRATVARMRSRDARGSPVTPPLGAPRGLLGVVILAVLVVFGVTGDEPTVTGHRVLVIGDSLTEGSAAQVDQTLRASGWDPHVWGIAGTSIGEWGSLAASSAQSTRPDIAVVELGTNNCLDWCRPLGPEIDVIVSGLLTEGVRRILWVNVQEDAPLPKHPQFVNDEIERAIVRWPQVSMIDLNANFAAHPEWRMPDGLHFNDQGKQIYAELVDRALRSATTRSSGSFGPRGTSPTTVARGA